MDKIINNVYESYEYSKFKKLLGNRDVKNVKAIIESIKSNGKIITPIIVNKRYEIIDGQNRFDAFVELNLSIPYIICEEYGIKECIAMNSTSLKWSISDYINCYAKYGYEDYVVLQKLEKDYSQKLSNRIIRVTATGNFAEYNIKKIREGSFKINKSENEVRKCLDYLSEFNIPKTIRGNVALLYYVLRFCYYFDDVDNTLLLNQFESLSHMIPGITDIRSAAESVEKIYNYKRKKDIVYIATEYRKASKESSASGCPGGNQITSWDKEEDKNE